MKKIGGEKEKMKTKVIKGIFVALIVIVAIGSSSAYYYGRWIDTQYDITPIEEAISVKTTSEPMGPAYPGDSYEYVHLATNENPKRSYEMTAFASANWEVIEECKISILCYAPEEPEPPVYEKSYTFTVNDSVNINTLEASSVKTTTAMETKDGKGYGEEYCVAPYQIPANGGCMITITRYIRNDAPTTQFYDNSFFWNSLETYRGRDY